MIANSEPDATWTCKLSLLKTHAYAGSRRSMEEVEELWYPMDRPESIELQTVTDKEKLERYIWLAQKAALTPGMDPREFFKGNGNPRASAQREEFSPNAVCLDISDRDIPNLSFCDLPGIINQTESEEDEYLVDVVRSLVKEKLEGETTLILLACSMGYDIQTSSAASLVRKAHAEHRCVGVLTKPDLLQIGDTINIWRDTLKGEKFQLGHDYFVTKQPSPVELERKIDHSEARMKEAEFFANSEPWTTELAMFKDRFGTDRLRIALAQELAAIINQSLPDIIEKIDERLAEINDALSRFPPKPTSNSYGIVLDILNNFTGTIQNHLEGVSDHTEFRMGWRKLAEAFYGNLKKICPDVEWQDDDNDDEASLPIRENGSITSTPSKNGAHEVVEILDDEDAPPVRRSKPSTPQNKRKLENRHPSTPGSSQSRQSAKRARTGKIRSVTAIARQQKFQLDQIQQTLIRFSLSGIPGEYDSKALDQLIFSSLQHWSIFLDQLVNSIEQRMEALFQTILRDLFSPYERTPLPGKVKKLTSEFVRTAIGDFINDTNRVLKLEKFKPVTFNRDILSTHIETQQAYLENRRFNERANVFLDDHEEYTGRKTEGTDRAKKINKEKENIKKELGEDEHQPTIKAMAKVRAYYKVAAPRFVDVVCQYAQAELFGECKENLTQHIKAGLGLEQPDRKLLGPSTEAFSCANVFLL